MTARHIIGTTRRAATVLTVAGLVLAGGVAVGAAPALAVTDCPNDGSSQWTNTAGGDWSNPANWSNGVPGPSCTAAITAAGTYTVAVTVGQSAAGIALGGASGTQTLQVQGNTRPDGNQQEGLLGIGAGNLTIGTRGVLQYTGSGTNPGAATTTGNGTILNSGLVRTDAGSLAGTRDIQNGVVNNADGHIDLHTDTITCSCGNTHYWTNNGTITTDPGTISTFSGTAQGVLFTQSGGTFVNSGRAEISGGFTFASGTTSGNPIEVCGYLDAHGTGAGSFEFHPMQEVNCGNGSGQLTGDVGPATHVLVHAEATTTVVNVSASLTNRGTITVNGGPGQPQLNGQPLTNVGTIHLAAAASAPSALVTSALTNTGTVDVGDGSSAILTQKLVQAGGTVTVGSGATIQANNNTAVTGGIISNGGTFVSNGQLDHTGGSVTGNPIELCGGNLNAPGPGSASFVIGRVANCSTMGLDGDIGAHDTVRIESPSAVIDVFFPGFTNHGSLSVVSDATHLVQLHISGNAPLVNEGTLLTTGSNLAVPIVNHGSWTVGAAAGVSTNFNQPISQSAGTLVVNGTLNAGNGTEIIGGTVSSSGTFVSSGQLDHTGGSVTGNPIELCGGDLNAPGPGSASFVIGRVANCSTMGLDGDIGAHDTVRIESPGAVIDVFFPGFTNHGSLSVVSDATHLVQLHISGSAPLVNEGTLLTTGSNLAVPIVNRGSWTVGAAAGVSTNFNQPITQVAGTLTIEGTLGLSGDLPVSGGMLQGGGTINGNVVNTGGTVRAGHASNAAPSRLTIAGNYTQGAHGVLAAGVAGSVAGSGYSQLAVSGSATLDGTLSVTTVHPQPAAGQPLHLLTAATRSGTFSSVAFAGQAFRVTYPAAGVDLDAVPAPVATAPPAVKGVAAVGQVLHATTGTFSGAPTTYRYAWLRCTAAGTGCAAITGAAGPALRVGAADVGHRLRVRVTAIGAGGQGVSTAAATKAVPRPAFTVALSYSPTAFTAAAGTTARVRLSLAATVSISITHRVAGHRSHGRCSTRARTGARCTVSVTVARVSRALGAGARQWKLSLRSLRPGTYTATLHARDGYGRVVTLTRALTVRPAKRG